MALRVLLVDDNNHFLQAARALLEREGVTVAAVASSSSEALQRIGEHDPDVALVDVDLGAESGFDLAERLARPPAGQPAHAVVLISAYPEQDLRDLIEASPALGFLHKSALSVRAIRDLLARTDGAGPGPAG